MKILRILGKRGRVTIPFEIREIVGFGYNDVLSFTVNDEDTVTIKKERIRGFDDFCYIDCLQSKHSRNKSGKNRIHNGYNNCYGRINNRKRSNDL